MQHHCIYHIRFVILPTLLLVLSACGPELYHLAGPSTRVVFNHPVDKRYAFIGNEAETIPYESEILSMIDGATTSIELSTMTFTKTEIAQRLREKAASGVRVRLIGNGGHRLGQDGWKEALKGPVAMIDNNLPALLHRINFQRPDEAVPAGWLADHGEPFGPKAGGVSYGWRNPNMEPNIRSAGALTNVLLDDCVAVRNSDGQKVWEIQVGEGFYYVAFVLGQQGFSSDNFLTIEDQPVIIDPATNLAVPNRSVGTNNFWGQSADGGSTVDADDGEDRSPNAVRIQVGSDGLLTLKLGDPGNGSRFSALNFLEIYKGSPEPEGDTSYEDTDNSMVQAQQTLHSKYLIIDAGLAGQKLWCSSANFTQGMDPDRKNSEDAIISTDPSLIQAFLSQFNMEWGSDGATPANPENSLFGTYKTPTQEALTIDGYPWHLYWSPSKAELDLSAVATEFVNGTQRNLMMVMQQFTRSDRERGFNGGAAIAANIQTKLNAGMKFHALLSKDGGINQGYFTGSNHRIKINNPEIMTMHHKYAVADALTATRHQLTGKVLAGSMNWTQSGMHYSDEHTLVIENPFIANQYLQHAMARIRDEGMAPQLPADIIMVLDRSGSMNESTNTPGVSKIEAVKQASEVFLDIIDRGGTHQLSMIRFGSMVEPFDPPIELTPFTNALATAYETALGTLAATGPIASSTCYNAALEAAMEQFDDTPGSNRRRIIHFFTDGKENCSPRSNTFFTQLNERNIEVHSTGFGGGSDMASSLEAMATATGGTYAQVSLSEMELKKRFAEVARNAMDLSTVLDPQKTIKPGQTESTNVYLNEGTTRAVFVLSWNGIAKDLKSMTLTAPNGQTFQSGNQQVEWIQKNNHLVVKVNTKDQFKVTGKWSIAVTAANQLSRGSLLSDLIVLANDPIHITGECLPELNGLSRNLLLCRVLDKNEPLKGLKVTASVQAPLLKENEIARIQQIVLFDDGKHHDFKANDGIYGASVPVNATLTSMVHFVAEGKVQHSGEWVPLRRELTTYSSKISKKKQ